MKQAANLAKQSDSTILILLVIVALIVIAFVPVMNTIAKIQERKRQQHYEREGQLIKVIQSNTEVVSSLKTLFESDQKHCIDCKSEQINMFRDLQEDTAIIKERLNDIHHNISKPVH